MGLTGESITLPWMGEKKIDLCNSVHMVHSIYFIQSKAIFFSHYILCFISYLLVEPSLGLMKRGNQTPFYLKISSKRSKSRQLCYCQISRADNKTHQEDRNIVQWSELVRESLRLIVEYGLPFLCPELMQPPHLGTFQLQYLRFLFFGFRYTLKYI